MLIGEGSAQPVGSCPGVREDLLLGMLESAEQPGAPGVPVAREKRVPLRAYLRFSHRAADRHRQIHHNRELGRVLTRGSAGLAGFADAGGDQCAVDADDDLACGVEI
jgi:hypothetical protein